MKIQSKRAKLFGSVTVPGSKSHTIRALILSTLAEGVSHIRNPLPSNDCLSTVEAINKIGATATKNEKENTWTVVGAGRNLHLPESIIDVGNSGSLMYFLCPILSTLSGWCIFTGDESIKTRPVNHLIDSLQQLDVEASSIKQNGTPPFIFKGPINNKKKLITDGKLSQYISGFMMAASQMDGEFNISLSSPKETPYLTMTQEWLKKVNVESTISPDFKNISVKGPVAIKAFDCLIPSDWEAIAFPLIASLITESNITIQNVDDSKSQGDQEIVNILNSIGANIVWNKENKTLSVEGKKYLSTENHKNNELNIKISDFPDAICALSVIACFTEGKTIISDIEICRKKETDRIDAMTKELSKLGADIHVEYDSLIINGHSPINIDGTENKLFTLHGGNVESYKDHRIAMSLSCLGLGLAKYETVTINEAECCSVSFPHFFEIMNQLGANFIQS
jgi:3-phosphoshikimate 1-carboxyvinyltransferase